MSCAWSHSSGRSASGGLPRDAARSAYPRISASSRGEAEAIAARCQQSTRSLEKRLHAQARGGLPERVEQLGHAHHVLRALDLGNHQRPDRGSGATHQQAHVVGEPRALDRVHAHRHLGARKLAALERRAHPVARFLLGPGRHRVLEVDHELVGVERGRLGEHRLGRPGHRQARSPGSHWRTLTARTQLGSSFFTSGAGLLEHSSGVSPVEAIGVAVWCFLVALAGGVVGLVLGNLRLPVMLLLASSPASGGAANIAVSGVAASAASIGHVRAGRINWRLFAWMAPPSVLGALVGGYLAGEISESVLLLAIAAVLLYSGLDLLRWERPAPAAADASEPRRLDVRAAVLSGLVIGLLGGLVGLILGALRMPALLEAGGRGAVAGGRHQPDGRRARGRRRPDRAPALGGSRLGSARRRRGGLGARARCSARGSRDGSPSASSCGPSARR